MTYVAHAAYVIRLMETATPACSHQSSVITLAVIRQQELPWFSLQIQNKQEHVLQEMREGSDYFDCS